MNRKIVAKVGGSLFDWPELKNRLSQWLFAESAAQVYLLPGGGDMADVIRAMHQIHHLPEIVSHWLAIRTMSVNAYFLSELLQVPVVTALQGVSTPHVVIDPVPFLQQDESSPDCLPHSWKVTSDSIAARLAQSLGAELVLLKSADQPKGTWEELAVSGFVDRYFPELIQSPFIPVRTVNLREYRESS